MKYTQHLAHLVCSWRPLQLSYIRWKINNLNHYTSQISTKLFEAVKTLAESEGKIKGLMG